jgi:hypothetical protein
MRVRTRNKSNKNMSQSSPTRGKFTILRGVDRSFTDLQEPKKVHFPNAAGGLRHVNSTEIRNLAKDSANRVIHALKD